MNSHDHEIEIYREERSTQGDREMEEGQVKSGLYSLCTCVKLPNINFN